MVGRTQVYSTDCSRDDDSISKGNARDLERQCIPSFIETWGPHTVASKLTLHTAKGQSPCILAVWLRNRMFECAKSTPCKDGIYLSVEGCNYRLVPVH